ncbi:hypothetical protein [uncultured Desulfuromonas sp.]|uniref:hypothetical protein n=1 Tax=uncultured Desulfuromonas sp. TaxID=181013 RepID=UPI002AAB0A54|nr:hypothetical protein [uncultured Desulfuromonas sp.]
MVLVIAPVHDGISRLKPLLQETISRMLKYWQEGEKAPSGGFSTAQAENAISVSLTGCFSTACQYLNTVNFVIDMPPVGANLFANGSGYCSLP